MSDKKIEQHIRRLAQGYRLWCVPLLMAMWDIGFKTGGANTVGIVAKNLFAQPHFLAVAAWAVILSLAMDRRGKLAVNTMTDTSQTDVINYILTEHSIFALLLALTPVVYFGVKGLWVYYAIGAADISLVWDIHGLFTLIAVYDGIKAVRANNVIKAELEV